MPNTSTPQGRALPRPIRRSVLEEAGYRCAIPTCRCSTTEIAHIVPWSEVRSHEFENLIALCPTCHRRYDCWDIPRSSMRVYKANLGLLAGRYSSFERRVLDYCIDNNEFRVRLPAGYRPVVYYLVHDGVLAEPVVERGAGGVTLGDDLIAGFETHELTALGMKLLADYRAARIIGTHRQDASGAP